MARKRTFLKQEEKAGWYLPTALLVDALGVALPVGAVFDATDQPRPGWCAVAAAAAWLSIAASRNRYSRRQLAESGSVIAVARDWVTLIGVLAVLHVVAGDSTSAAAALVALLPCVLVTVVRRKAMHRHLLATRREAQAVRRVLVVGETTAADHIVGHLARRTDHEFVAVGICAIGEGASASGLPVYTRLGGAGARPGPDDAAAVLESADTLGADLIFVAPGQHMAGERLRRLSWALHDNGRPLAVLPGLTDVSRRRVRLASAAGLTLMHVAPPIRRGLPSVLKTVTDRVGALALIVGFSPLFTLVALAVRLDSKGPAFHQQIRIGKVGRPFRMWKFRTMIDGAERLRGELESANENDGHMFKMRKDPRVTRVGRFLRRYSLDELPQLFNVLAGHMSLVGPRPPLPEEVARYDEVEMRRLSVRPGLTGLWQVSGRSDLSWDETVALDLSYVDNWSLARDVDVMARTLRAVVDGRGAY
ncbi:sugar transferase [Wenjunlia tyrosinilytica]|nr:sugar transferase [Wenjunlia tyrosinilytica]